MGNKGKRMLIIRLSALGDVAMTVPAIYSLAEKYPDLTVDVVTRPFFARLFINPPANVNVIGVDFKGEYKGIGGTLRLLRRLGGLHPDCVADLHNVLRSWIIDNYFRLRGVRVEMVDKLRSKRSRLFKTGEQQPSFINRYAEVFSRLGYPIELTFRSLYSRNAAALSFEPQHPAIGIAPFARYFNKTYPVGQMREVIRGLCSAGYHVYLFGGRGSEAEEMQKWAASCANCESLAGRYQLEEEIALMGAMDAMVSMDSANQHMAALTGTKVVSIWGSTTPACGFLGYRQDRKNALCLDLPCQPCTVGGSPECPKGHFDCMSRLEPKSVVDRIMELVPPAKSDFLKRT